MAEFRECEVCMSVSSQSSYDEENRLPSRIPLAGEWFECFRAFLEPKTRFNRYMLMRMV